MMAAQQGVQQNAQSIDVGGRGHGFTSYLLWRSAQRRQRPSALARQLRCPSLAFRFDQFGNSEVQQLHPAARTDQNIRWLEVSVNDQIGVRLRDRCQYVEKQANARFDIEPLMIAVLIDGFAVDVL